MSLVVIGLQCAWSIIGGIIASAIAVVAHEIVASQWGNLLHQRLLRHDRDVVAYEAIEGVDIVEGILGVMLVEVLSLGDETTTMEGQACVIHRDRDIGWLDLLRAQHEVDVREEKLRLGGIVDALGPVVLLVGQARAIEDTGVHHDREANVPGIAHLGTHVTHIAHLLGDERAVGEVLLMRRAMRIDGEWHTLLTDGQLEGLPWGDAGIGIEHLDAALVAEVDLNLVAHRRGHLARYVDTSRAHLESALPFLGLVFILGADGTAYLRRLIHFFLFLGIHRCHRHHQECRHQEHLLHFL